MLRHWGVLGFCILFFFEIGDCWVFVAFFWENFINFGNFFGIGWPGGPRSAEKLTKLPKK